MTRCLGHRCSLFLTSRGAIEALATEGAFDPTMYLIEILLPLRANDGASAQSEFTRVREILTDRFGGLTAFMRAPADGFWKDPNDGDVARDDIAVIEVMTEDLDAEWWSTFRADLELRLGQKEIVIRWHQIGRI